MVEKGKKNDCLKWVYHGGKETYKHSRAWTICKERVGENTSWEVQEAYRWLQEMVGGCHHCQRVCNQILMPGAIIAAHAVFSVSSLKLQYVGWINTFPCYITLGLQITDPDVYIWYISTYFWRYCRGYATNERVPIIVSRTVTTTYKNNLELLLKVQLKKYVCLVVAM